MVYKLWLWKSRFKIVSCKFCLVCRYISIAHMLSVWVGPRELRTMVIITHTNCVLMSGTSGLLILELCFARMGPENSRLSDDICVSLERESRKLGSMGHAPKLRLS